MEALIDAVARLAWQRLWAGRVRFPAAGHYRLAGGCVKDAVRRCAGHGADVADNGGGDDRPDSPAPWSSSGASPAPASTPAAPSNSPAASWPSRSCCSPPTSRRGPSATCSPAPPPRRAGPDRPRRRHADAAVRAEGKAPRPPARLTGNHRRRHAEHLCAYLSLAVLIGLGANALAGLWWADPLVALIVAIAAVQAGIRTWRGAPCGQRRAEPHRWPGTRDAAASPSATWRIPSNRAYSQLAASSMAAEPPSSTGQILNQTTGVRAPVSAVSVPNAISSPAATR